MNTNALISTLMLTLLLSGHAHATDKKCSSYEKEIASLKRKLDSFTTPEVINTVKTKKDVQRIEKQMEPIGIELNKKLVDPRWKGCPSNISDQIAQ